MVLILSLVCVAFALLYLPVSECTCPSKVDLGTGDVYALQATQDVFLERGYSNYKYYDFLILAKHPQYPKKRSLIQFQDLPTKCCKHVVWAKMYLYFWYAHKASWYSYQQAPYISRTVQVHQMKKSWKEGEATSLRPRVGAQWNQQYVALDDQDAVSHSQGTGTTFFTLRPSGYVEFDVTEAVRNWNYGEPNYGLLIWATNEDVNGRDLRFYSKERSTGKPIIRVQCA